MFTYIILFIVLSSIVCLIIYILYKNEDEEDSKSEEIQDSNLQNAVNNAYGYSKIYLAKGPDGGTIDDDNDYKESNKEVQVTLQDAGVMRNKAKQAEHLQISFLYYRLEREIDKCASLGKTCAFIDIKCLVESLNIDKEEIFNLVKDKFSQYNYDVDLIGTLISISWDKPYN